MFICSFCVFLILSLLVLYRRKYPNCSQNNQWLKFPDRRISKWPILNHSEPSEIPLFFKKKKLVRDSFLEAQYSWVALEKKGNWIQLQNNFASILKSHVLEKKGPYFFDILLWCVKYRIKWNQKSTQCHKTSQYIYWCRAHGAKPYLWSRIRILKIPTHLALSDNLYFQFFCQLSDWVEILWDFMKFFSNRCKKFQLFILKTKKSYS